MSPWEKLKKINRNDFQTVVCTLNYTRILCWFFHYFAAPPPLLRPLPQGSFSEAPIPPLFTAARANCVIRPDDDETPLKPFFLLRRRWWCFFVFCFFLRAGCSIPGTISFARWFTGLAGQTTAGRMTEAMVELADWLDAGTVFMATRAWGAAFHFCGGGGVLEVWKSSCLFRI